MENASKALLIAGAILIAIVLISLGVMILGQGSDLVKNTNMSSAEIQTYNSEWEAYLGSNIRGSNLTRLREKIQQHYRENKDDKSKVIQMTDAGSVQNVKAKSGTTEDHDGAEVIPVSGYIKSGYSYTVSAAYNSGGLISKIYYHQN